MCWIQECCNSKLKRIKTTNIYIYIWIRVWYRENVCALAMFHSSSKATGHINNWIAIVVAIATIKRIASTRSLAPFLRWVNVCMYMRELKMIRCTGSDVMASQLLGRWSTRRGVRAMCRRVHTYICMYIYMRIFTSNTDTEFTID